MRITDEDAKRLREKLHATIQAELGPTSRPNLVEVALIGWRLGVEAAGDHWDEASLDQGVSLAPLLRVAEQAAALPNDEEL